MPTRYNDYSYYSNYGFTIGYYSYNSNTMVYPVTFNYNYIVPQQVDNVSFTIRYKPKKQKLDLE